MLFYLQELAVGTSRLYELGEAVENLFFWHVQAQMLSVFISFEFVSCSLFFHGRPFLA